MTGPPSRICWRNFGTTEPDDPSTFPKRTMEKIVPLLPSLACAHDICGPDSLVGTNQYEI